MLISTKNSIDDTIIIKTKENERLILTPCFDQDLSVLFSEVLNIHNKVLIENLIEVITGQKPHAILRELRLYPDHLELHHEILHRGKKSHIILSRSAYTNSFPFNKNYKDTFFLEVSTENQVSSITMESHFIVFSDAGFTVNAEDGKDLDPIFVPSFA